jgi:iron complex outermembrane recepter protein
MKLQQPLIVMAVAAALAGPATAQEGGSPVLDEIIVTAQKRAQSLQDVPIAITAFDSAALETSGIASVDDIAQRAPGLTIGRFNAVQPQIYIRGIGSTDQSASGDQSVGVFLDGVFLGRVGTSDLDFFDLERVEVLRGPQGTLYGKNVVGGAINIITQRPSDEFDARFELGAGNYSRRSVRGLVTGPINDEVSGKLSVSSVDRDGYSTSATTGEDLSDEKNNTVRGQLLVSPWESTELLLTIDWAEDRLAGNNRECLGEQFVFFPWFAPGSPFAGSPCSPDPYLNEKTVDGYQDREIFGLSAQLTQDTRFGELNSITAYRSGEYDILEDFDGSDTNLVIRHATDEIEQWSQELRLSDVAMGGRLNWLVGAYGYWAEIDRLENNDFSGNDVPLGLPAFGLSFNTFYYQRNRTTSYALFSDLSFGLSDTVNLSVGGRYTHEEKLAEIRTEGFDPTGSFLAAPYDVRTRESWNSFTPKVTLDWQASDEMMLYASVADGHKSGGFNGTAPDAVSAQTPFDEEKARQYEVGLKSEWFDRRLRSNLTAFYIDYEDLQVFQLVDGARLIVDNAADATSKGFEVELLARLTDGLTATASYAYLDATYKDFINEAGEDYSGNRLTRSPKNSYNVALTNRANLGANLGLILHGEYSYRSRVYYNPDNWPLTGDDSLGLLDARATLEFLSHNVDLSVWGRNLTDEVYVTQAIDGRGPFNLTQNAAGVIGAPRMYGVTVNWRFR